jgi:carboxyl-terminal processing protease
MNKKISLGAALMMTALTAAVAITISILFTLNVVNRSIADFTQRESLFKKLSEVDAIVRQNYNGKIDENTLVDYTVRGYVNGLSDKYGIYLDAAAYRQIELANQGKSSGIGINAIATPDGYIKVLAVLGGSPAEAAGIKPNDIIMKVGGTDVKSLGYETAISKLRGDAGTTAQLTVTRGNQLLEFDVVRQAFDTQTVNSRMIGGNIGFVRVMEFDANTPAQFSTQVDSLISKGAKALIFDMRNNPGGLLSSAEIMIDKVVPEGPVVRAKYKDGTVKTLYTSDANQINLPMAVLINQNSASAAELFAAALKDYKKAKTVGSITYGKGTMQQIFDLNDGTALDLSVALFYPPTSDNFEGKGVTPDIAVDLSQAKLVNFYSLTEAQDDQLQAALSYLRTVIK